MGGGDAATGGRALPDTVPWSEQESHKGLTVQVGRSFMERRVCLYNAAVKSVFAFLRVSLRNIIKSLFFKPLLCGTIIFMGWDPVRS